MIDTFSLALSHALLFYVAVRLMLRPDLDSEESAEPDEKTKGFGRRA